MNSSLLLVILAFWSSETSAASFTFGSIHTSLVPFYTPKCEKGNVRFGRGMIYLLKPSSFLVCCDDRTKTVHYFLHRKENTITRCLWTSSPSDQTRCDVMRELREWYEGVFHDELESDFDNERDVSAWEDSFYPFDI